MCAGAQFLRGKRIVENGNRSRIEYRKQPNKARAHLIGLNDNEQPDASTRRAVVLIFIMFRCAAVGADCKETQYI